MEAREVILMTAACCHRGDTYHRRQWSRVTGAVFLLWCGRTVSSSSLGEADDLCHHGTSDRPVSRWHEGGSKLLDGNFDPFPWDPACSRRRWRLHDCEIASRLRTRWFEESTGTPPGPPQCEKGPSGNGKFVLTSASSTQLVNRESLSDWQRHAAPY